ncbi:hypothetical protein CVT26_005077 [Gymnopilus dilepis]|uniref:Uncharacterized protein n=1 Tax=Gymnopilus dilepis TaxID=231916 RepID=A0A409W8F1_9AGAR|nr:hypothetical protein CVT26_005077 [Gymnopilus dilepis]
MTPTDLLLVANFGLENKVISIEKDKLCRQYPDGKLHSLNQPTKDQGATRRNMTPDNTTLKLNSQSQVAVGPRSASARHSSRMPRKTRAHLPETRPRLRPLPWGTIVLQYATPLRIQLIPTRRMVDAQRHGMYLADLTYILSTMSRPRSKTTNAELPCIITRWHSLHMDR